MSDSFARSCPTRVLGFRIRNEDVDINAGVEFSKLETRLKIIHLPLGGWSGIGVLGNLGVFPSAAFPDVGAKTIHTSVPIPNDWVVGTNITLMVVWSTSVIIGNIFLQVSYAGRADGELTASEDMVGITDTARPAANQLNEASGALSSAFLAAGNHLGISILREGAHVNDTLGADIRVHEIYLQYVGR